MRYVAIKGMEIPAMCEDCQIAAVVENYYGDIMSRRCPVTGEATKMFGWRGTRNRPDWCPLVIVEGEEVEERK